MKGYKAGIIKFKFEKVIQHDFIQTIEKYLETTVLQKLVKFFDV